MPTHTAAVVVVMVVVVDVVVDRKINVYECGE